MKRERRKREIAGRLLLGLILTGVWFWTIGQPVLATDTETQQVNLQPSPQWQAAQHMSTTSTNGAFAPTIAAAPNGTLMIAYGHAVDSQVTNPYYRLKPAGEAAWSAPAPIRNSGESLRQTRLAFDNNNNAHALWRTGDAVYHARQNQWPNSHNVVANPGISILDPALAIGGDGVLHAVWAQGDNLHEIHHAYSTNNGGDWILSPPLSDNQRRSSSPAIAVDQQGHVHVVWQEQFVAPGPTFQYRLHYKKGNKSGSTYTFDSNPTVISGNVVTAFRPALQAAGNNLQVAFARRISDSEQYAYYVQYTAGSGWGAPVDVTNGNPVGVNTNSPFNLVATLTGCEDALHLYYHGNLSPEGKEQIFGNQNHNNSGWSSRDVATANERRSVNPVMICVNGVLHLVYEDITITGGGSLEYQVYYRNTIHLAFLPIIQR